MIDLDLRLVGTRRVPFVAATELNECGLACLAAVSEYFRGELALAEIRRLANHGGRGETLLDIRNIAERMGLAARGVRLELPGLAALGKPAILHWEMNHFVVLERVTRSGVVIMDPAAGRVAVRWAELNESFTGVALELAPGDSWKRRSRPPRRVSVLSFVGPFSHWRGQVGLIIALLLLLEVFVLVMPLQMQMSIDNALLAADGGLVWVLGIGFGLFALIQASVAVVRAWSTAVFGARVGYELRDRFVRALHRKSARFFLGHHTADILSRAHSVDVIQSLVTAQLIQALQLAQSAPRPVQHARELRGREVEVATDGLAVFVAQVEAHQHLTVACAAHVAQRRFDASRELVFQLLGGLMLERVEC